MLKIVTDGGADMPAEWLDRYDIHILPLKIHFGEETYVQGENLDSKKFYDLIIQKRVAPKTSLPSPAQIVAFYRNIASRGDRILSIHIGSRLSGTFEAVQLAARECAGEMEVYPFDSLAGSAVLGFMCREARLMERAGQSIDGIIQRLEEVRNHLTVIFTLDQTELAYLSGRISQLQNALASLLNIKPVIVLRDGLLQMADKVRTRRKSLDHVLEKVRQRISGQEVDIAVVHAGDPATAQNLFDYIRQHFHVRNIFITELSLPVASHLGQGAVGIVAYPVHEGE